MPDVFKEHIRPGDDGRVVLIGFPYDEGVARVGGRPGARRGPERFRAWFRRYGSVDNPQLNLSLSQLPVSDAGDIPQGLPLEQAHDQLKRRVETVLANGGIPFIVGGGNDQSYPGASALLDHFGNGHVGVINVDAHLDVRPLIEGRAHSGSPFRLLLEDKRFSASGFVEFACQGAQCSGEHARYVRDKGGHLIWLGHDLYQEGIAVTFRAMLGQLAWNRKALFVSFDLDSVQGADAPGVSCPGVLGLKAQEAVEIALTAGSHPKVTLFDLSEYNPDIEDERTGRLAVALFYHFCLGVAQRKPSS